MSEENISSIHVQKLGHKILEIRERALFNILSKLERGILFDNDFSRCKEIIIKLFDWFQFDDFTYEDIVLTLLKRVINNESGLLLINLFGREYFETELLKIKSLVKEELHEEIDCLLAIISKDNKSKSKHLIPPLKSDQPLSYRSNVSCNGVETTASTLEGFVKHSASTDYKIECDLNLDSPSSDANRSKRNKNILYFLPWHSLLASDRQVLDSLEETLRNPSEPVEIMNSCDFFRDVLLYDFPAEIFLQRPSIIKLFFDTLWTSPSSRITTSVLICLGKLTKAIKTRISFFADPNIYNLKNLKSLKEIDNYSPNFNKFINGVNCKRENNSETALLMKKALSIPEYALSVILSVCDYLYVPEGSPHFRRKKCQVGINSALLLFYEATDLFLLTVTRDFWTESLDSPAVAINKKLNEVFLKVAELLEHFRLSILSSDWDVNFRLVHLQLIVITNYFMGKLISFGQFDKVLPRDLKDSISNSILDPTLRRFYPSVHENLIVFAKTFKGSFDEDSFKKYEQVDLVCKSLSSVILFFRDWKSLPVINFITLAKESLVSLEFHQCLEFIKIFLDVLYNKIGAETFEDSVLSNVDDVIVSLLAHKCEDIKLETYKQCQKKVISTIGAKLNYSKTSTPGSQIVFLLRSKILKEIALYGIVDKNIQVQNYAEDIVIHLLKCKILVTDDIWMLALEAIIPNLPILTCHISLSSLGRCILSILDPDRGVAFNIPTVEVYKGNCGLLFSENSQIREEAVSRLCWLLSSETDSHTLLPHTNNLHDKALSLVFQIKKPEEYGQSRFNQHFFQPSALHQVTDLLKSEKVEPAIRRSAITQVSVMLQDPILHQTFLEENGLSIVKSIMKSALNEKNYNDYPDSVIACLNILKNLCLYNTMVRNELSNDLFIYQYCLRGLFMFCTEENVKKDGSTLIFLLVYSNYFSGTLLKSDFGLPALVLNKLRSPFICNKQSIESSNSLPSYLHLLSDKLTLNSLRIHWNVGWLKDSQKLFEITEFTADFIPIKFNERLILKKMDLLACKSTSLEYNLMCFLKKIENAANHKDVMDSINILQCCLNLFIILNKNDAINLDIVAFSWSKSFTKYLNTPPGGTEDTVLLSNLLKFLENLLPVFKLRENSTWITSFLTNKNHFIHNLIDFEDCKSEESKNLMYTILNFVKSCVSHEQRYLDFQKVAIDEENGVTGSWGHLVETIIENLQFNDFKHFYNLAFMEKYLLATVHLTSNFGWSNSLPNEPPKKLLSQMTSGLLELIGAFYFGKGDYASDSLMGSNITRNVIIILNHIVMELQHLKVKKWEELFLNNDPAERNCLKTILDLITSKDVVLRAASIHLLAGLCVSTRLAISLVQDVELNSKNIWELALEILIDPEEASSVKEGTASLLTNMTTHTKTLSEELVLINNILPLKNKTQKNADINIILKILDDINFFNQLSEVLKHVYFKKEIQAQLFLRDGRNSVEDVLTIDSLSSADIPNTEHEKIIITPGAVKGISLFLFNFLALDSKNICKGLLDNNLIKMLLRCLHLPIMEITTTKDFSLYCDILEMNTAICLLLNRAASERADIISMIYNTRDCFNILLYLLNPDIYAISLPQLLFLRSKLWSSIFNLLETLLLSGETDIEKVQSTEAFTIITNLIKENCAESFLKSVCQSIADKNFNELQLSALSSLTSLLTLGNYADNYDNQDLCSSRSVKSLLDFTRTPRLSSIECSTESAKDDSYITKTLEGIYFNENYVGVTNKIDDYSEQHMAGSELCRILLHLFEFINLKDTKCSLKKRYSIINTLTSLLSISTEAKRVAYNYGLDGIIVAQLKEIYIKLSLEPVDFLRRSSDKKRVCPLLKDLELYVCLINNFLVDDEEIKIRFAKRELADVTHKLWVWFSLQKPHLILSLKMLCSFTNNCKEACETLPLTSGIAGSGPRKVPNNASLLTVVCSQVSKEMDQISKTHSLTTLQLCFQLLTNCLPIVDCRVTILKNNLLQNFLRLHPAITKRQKPWDNVENLWLEFLNEFTFYPEGQACVVKTVEVFDVLVSLASSAKQENKTVSLEVLRNASFYAASRARLLTSSDFIQLLSSKLSTGTIKEKNIVVSIIWSVAANNHKAKLVFKSAHIPNKLHDIIKGLQLYNSSVDSEDLQRMAYVYDILKGEKT